MKFRFSRHAFQEIKNRNIPIFWVRRTLQKPEQIIPQKNKTTKVFQSKFRFNDGKIYLVRVIVNEMEKPAVVVTVYRNQQN